MYKKYLEKIPEWLLLPLFGILFLAFWPIILIYSGTKSLFGSKSNDEAKIAGAKVAIITIFSIAILVLLSIYENSISEFFNGILSGPLLIFLLIGLIVMALLQKLFPKWKYIQSNSDIVSKG